MNYDSQTPYIASFGILRKDGKIAFLLRSNTSWMNDHYCVPTGKVEKGESYTQAAIREFFEELGITVHEEQLRYCHTMYWKAETSWVNVYFEILDYEGTPRNAEPEVHSELVYFDPKKLPDNIIPSIRFALEQIDAGKMYSEYEGIN